MQNSSIETINPCVQKFNEGRVKFNLKSLFKFSPKIRISQTLSVISLTSAVFPPPEVLLDPCRTWCPSSNCQAVCQLKESDSPALPQLVQCAVCALEFCSACKANWHPGQACQESNLPITSFLPGENRYGRVGGDESPGQRRDT